MNRYLIQYVEIDIGSTTHRYISANTPIEIINDYYGAKPLISSITDYPAEIKEKDTVNRRLKVTLLDELTYKSAGTLSMTSYWRMWIAANPNYKNKIIRYYTRLGTEADFQLRFTGTIDNLQIGSNGNVTIEGVDLLKELSKQDYPVLTSLRLTEGLAQVYNVTAYGEMVGLSDAVTGDYAKFIFNIQAIPYSTDASLNIDNATYSFRLIIYKGGNIVGISNWTTFDYSPYVGTGTGISIVSFDIPNILQSDDFILQASWGANNKQFTNGNGWGGNVYVIDVDDFTDAQGSYSVAEEEAIYFQLDGTYSNIDDWDLVAPENIEAGISGDINIIPDSGYLRIDEEIIYYSHVVDDSEGGSLTGIIRGMFGTETPSHDPDTAIYYIICVQDPTDAFEVLKNLLLIAGIDTAYIASNFDDYQALNLLDVTCLPIIKEGKLSDPFFDLVNLMDCICFQNEEGQIDILRQSERPDEFVQLNDEQNLIFNSCAVDLQDSSRYTRWVIYWQRYDINKGLNDQDAYERGNLTVDGLKEEFYGDVNIDFQYSAWLNENDSTTIEDAIDYANDLLNLRRIRTNRKQFILAGELEIKDDSVVLGQVLKISTGLVLDEIGEPEYYQYRVVYKERRENKIFFKFRRLYDPITPLSFAGLRDWYRNCCTTGLIAPLSYQTYWQSYFFEQAEGGCAFQGQQDGTVERTVIGGFNPLADIANPSVVQLDGYNIWAVEWNSIVGGKISQKSMLPNIPSRLAAEPELTIFIILSIDDGDPGTPLQAFRMRGSDAASDIIISTTGDSPDRIAFTVRSANTYSYTVEDTEAIENDGKYYLVCVQYSHSRQWMRLIIDGRTFEYTAPPGTWDKFEFDWNVAIGAAGVVVGSNDQGGAIWRGKIGEVIFYDPHVFSDYDINLLANEYYKAKYESLEWTDI